LSGAAAQLCEEPLAGELPLAPLFGALAPGTWLLLVFW
jgi:hypothetical protein